MVIELLQFDAGVTMGNEVWRLHVTVWQFDILTVWQFDSLVV
jgi:hypothetical protein